MRERSHRTFVDLMVSLSNHEVAATKSTTTSSIYPAYPHPLRIVHTPPISSARGGLQRPVAEGRPGRGGRSFPGLEGGPLRFGEDGSSIPLSEMESSHPVLKSRRPEAVTSH